ncbi:MAG: isoprenoid biosynthesis glyoxalase ElbB [Lentisphaeraceae bacterium]|nr:isoprenoid biosynthesis glyoxalase ElbB [Lentisphaeraceae bacterium]
MGKKVGVLLSGCGVFDGSEIHEAVITLLKLDQAGVEVVAMAPNAPQLKVVDHVTSTDLEESRNVLKEASRISRGNIKSVSDVNIAELDALIIPGGFGAALNLCDFAVNGPEGTVDESVRNLIESVFAKKLPIGAMCIAPALVALALKDKGLKLTIGSDVGVASGIEALGHSHVNCETQDIVIDTVNKVVTTPAYMTAGGIAEAYEGISKLVDQVLELA